MIQAKLVAQLTKSKVPVFTRLMFGEFPAVKLLPP
jgi:hypothetical protein